MFEIQIKFLSRLAKMLENWTLQLSTQAFAQMFGFVVVVVFSFSFFL
jgi:hypothetical protein